MFTAAGVAAVCAVVVGLLLAKMKTFKRKVGFMKIASMLMIVVGFGVSGLVGRWMHKGTVFVIDHLNHALAKFIGTAEGGTVAGLVIAICLIGWYGIEMAKGHKPTKFTPWLGLLQFPIAAPLLPGAAGDTASSAGHTVFDAIQSFLISVFS